jgi:hypothetical protein
MQTPTYIHPGVNLTVIGNLDSFVDDLPGLLRATAEYIASMPGYALINVSIHSTMERYYHLHGVGRPRWYAYVYWSPHSPSVETDLTGAVHLKPD